MALMQWCQDLGRYSEEDKRTTVDNVISEIILRKHPGTSITGVQRKLQARGGQFTNIDWKTVQRHLQKLKNGSD